MTVNPQTQEIWATGMGRDHLGDNLPPDEINIIHQGNDYGWPYCYGNNVPDPRFLDQDEVAGACQGKTPPFVEIPAHSAPLGLAFFPARNWPEKYRNNLLVAYHGSWNRSIPTGYKVVLFRFDTQGKYLGREDFISGWLQNRKTSMGRPVDIKIMAKDLIYISDDKAGVIYRLARKRSP
jgi:glucose/arabinose dehydrogenase